MQKTCTQCGASFEITTGDLAFYDKVSPVIGGKKYKVPPPTLCPACRAQRRQAHFNYEFLYKRKSDKTGKAIVSSVTRSSSATNACIATIPTDCATAIIATTATTAHFSMIAAAAAIALDALGCAARNIASSMSN